MTGQAGCLVPVVVDEERKPHSHHNHGDDQAHSKKQLGSHGPARWQNPCPT